MERVQRLLRELGLTEYESRAYAVLVSIGPSTAGELSKLANVPYSRIYEILSKLEKRGWVEVQAGRPSRYRSKAPAEVIKLVKGEQERKLKEIGDAVVKQLEPLYSKKAEAKRPDVWVIRGWKNLLTKIGEMLNRAQIEALISIPNLPQELSGLSSYMPLLEAKNITIQLLLSNKLRLRRSELPKKIDIRKRGTLFGGGVVIDGREVLLVLGSGEEILGIWSDEIGLARFAKEYFEYLWKDSETMK